MQANTLSVDCFPDICRFCLVYASPENELFPMFLHHGQNGRHMRNTNECLPDIVNSCLGIVVSICYAVGP